MTFVRVALDVPLPRLFDYVAADAVAADVGRRVIVPFGNGSKVGVVTGVSASTDQPADKLKPVESILRDMPPLPVDWLALCEFCSRYYQHPLGQVMAFALPPMLRKGKLPREIGRAHV
jgi:primosomal protein N' (replication factor Y)